MPNKFILDEHSLAYGKVSNGFFVWQSYFSLCLYLDVNSTDLRLRSKLTSINVAESREWALASPPLIYIGKHRNRHLKLFFLDGCERNKLNNNKCAGYFLTEGQKNWLLKFFIHCYSTCYAHNLLDRKSLNCLYFGVTYSAIRFSSHLVALLFSCLSAANRSTSKNRRIFFFFFAFSSVKPLAAERLCSKAVNFKRNLIVIHKVLVFKNNS